MSRTTAATLRTSVSSRWIAGWSAAGAMAFLVMASAMPVEAQDTPVDIPAGDNALFSARVLTTGLSNPWAMLWGPDEMLWVTERSSGEVTRIDPYTGEQETLLTLTDFSVDVQHQGLMGMALHPELMTGTGNDYVYLAYTYSVGTEEAPDVRQRLVRYTYDDASVQLVDPVVLIEDVPAWNDHNGGRLQIDGDVIYYTLGEQGANFGGNFRRPNLAQMLPTQEMVDAGDWTAYSGKVLRVNLADGSIPEDNPVIDGVQSHIFTYGHRNPQGIALGADGTVYVAEHGPDSDDELNILTGGGNYGWPNVAGYRDDLSYVYANWSEAPEDQRYTGRTGIPDTVPQMLESEFPGEIVEPVATYFTVGNEYDFTANCGWICNPTIAPSALAYYEAGESGIAEWDNALLLPTLKHGVLYVQHLSEDGQSVDGLPEAWFSTQNRYRDVVVGPDNSVFLATDGFGTVAEKYGDTGFTNVLHNPGAILVFSYVGADGSAAADGVTIAPGAGDEVQEPVEQAAVEEAPAADGETIVPGTEEEIQEPVEQAAVDEAAMDDAAATDAAPEDHAAMDMDSLMTQGQTVYARNCSACHGPAGQGAQGPGFVGNEDALGDATYLAGMIVDGFGYMPAFGHRLDDEQVAAVSTFIRNSWGNDYGPVAPEEVAEVR